MGIDNPYQSPSMSLPQQDRAQPHDTSFWKEAWRGAKFGGKITACVATALTLLTFTGMFLLVVYRWITLGAQPLDQLGGWMTLAIQIGNSLAAIALLTAYSAIAGAVVMGLAALVRRARTAIARYRKAG